MSKPSRVIPPRRIVVPVTLATDSSQTVSVAGALAAPLDAELVLVGVAPPAPTVRPAAQVEDGAWLATDTQQHFLDQLIRERLEELTGALPQEAQVRSILTWGPPGPAIIEAAREERAELIVVGMRRAWALGHGLHDHVDRHVLHHSDVPVLVVPTTGPRALRR
jgi:nucleotide-binding universal stress UspA family protein